MVAHKIQTIIFITLSIQDYIHNICLLTINIFVR